MRITILIDNAPNPTADLAIEHGLSIYFEVDNSKWLMDVGASGKFAENANKLGISIADVDYLIISHAHVDHGGGLEEFVRLNSKAKIFLSQYIRGNRYFSTRRGTKRDISMDYSVVEKNVARVIFVHSNTEISPSVTLLCDIPQLFDMPQANRTLYVNDEADDFRHEIALRIATPDGDVVVSACSHLGITNTLAACGGRNVLAYIGGTHLIDSDNCNQYESDGQVIDVSSRLKLLYPNVKLISGHCTGTNAQKIFAETLSDQFSGFYSGFSMEF